MSQESTNPDGPSRKPRWLGFAQLALIVVAVAVALYFARAPDRVERGPITGAAQATPVVSVVKPAATAHMLTLKLTGTVTLERKTTVVSEVVGRVVWVSPNFANGGSLAANEVFVRIDPREYELEVEAAKMAVRQIEAMPGSSRPVPRCGKRWRPSWARRGRSSRWQSCGWREPRSPSPMRAG